MRISFSLNRVFVTRKCQQNYFESIQHTINEPLHAIVESLLDLFRHHVFTFTAVDIHHDLQDLHFVRQWNSFNKQPSPFTCILVPLANRFQVFYNQSNVYSVYANHTHLEQGQCHHTEEREKLHIQRYGIYKLKHVFHCCNHTKLSLYLNKSNEMLFWPSVRFQTWQK